MDKIADATDRRILKALATNARISNNDLAETAGITAAPCLRRVRRMEADGIIQGYVTRIDPTIDGWTTSAFLLVRLNRQHASDIAMFEDAIRQWDEVVECSLVAGSPDYILKVLSTGVRSHESFIKDRIAKLNCVSTIETCFVMSTIKDTAGVA